MFRSIRMRTLLPHGQMMGAATCGFKGKMLRRSK
jgi:hypothetical protein